MRINENYLKLKESYLFTNINKKVRDYQAAHPEADIIRLGIGDVTLPLCRASVDAMRTAAKEMADAKTFRGYGPEQGYPFLREAISAYYAARGVTVSPDEIFVGDGAKSDLGNILDIFSKDNTVLVPDPVYPVYVDTNVMNGNRLVYMKGTEENGFLPLPDEKTDVDIIYLCSPNNPTGAVYGAGALKNGSITQTAAAPSSSLTPPTRRLFRSVASRSIYEIEGAKTCAIEFCSFSKPPDLPEPAAAIRSFLKC